MFLNRADLIKFYPEHMYAQPRFGFLKRNNIPTTPVEERFMIAHRQASEELVHIASRENLAQLYRKYLELLWTYPFYGWEKGFLHCFFYLCTTFCYTICGCVLWDKLWSQWEGVCVVKDLSFFTFIIFLSLFYVKQRFPAINTLTHTWIIL